MEHNRKRRYSARKKSDKLNEQVQKIVKECSASVKKKSKENSDVSINNVSYSSECNSSDLDCIIDERSVSININNVSVSYDEMSESSINDNNNSEKE